MVTPHLCRSFFTIYGFVDCIQNADQFMMTLTHFDETVPLHLNEIEGVCMGFTSNNSHIFAGAAILRKRSVHVLQGKGRFVTLNMKGRMQISTY